MDDYLDQLKYYLEHPNSFQVFLLAILVVFTACGFTAIYMESSNTGEGMLEFILNRMAGKPKPIVGPEAIAARVREQQKKNK